jgi:hypothetical protein
VFFSRLKESNMAQAYFRVDRHSKARDLDPRVASTPLERHRPGGS